MRSMLKAISPPHSILTQRTKSYTKVSQTLIVRNFIANPTDRHPPPSISSNHHSSHRRHHIRSSKPKLFHARSRKMPNPHSGPPLALIALSIFLAADQIPSSIKLSTIKRLRPFLQTAINNAMHMTPRINIVHYVGAHSWTATCLGVMSLLFGFWWHYVSDPVGCMKMMAFCVRVLLRAVVRWMRGGDFIAGY